MTRRKILLFSLILIFSNWVAVAQEETLDAIEVAREEEDVATEYWEENRGTQILSGKKSTVTKLKEIPQIQTNNFRQALAKTTGLLVSEVINESNTSLTYRGLGDPHESFNVLLLQDGLPVASDMYAYPANYFSPALPMMNSTEFIRGGASLIYGPQPGGVLNFTSNPLTQNQKLSGRVGVTGGSYNLLTSNNAVYGSKNDHSYGVEYFRRQGDGLQRNNSDFYADYVQVRDHIFKGKNKYKISFNGYNSDHGLNGGFAKRDGPNANMYGKDQRKATTYFDRLRASRAQLALGLDRELDEDSKLSVTLWGVAYRRYSSTQNGAGFGRIPTLQTTNIQTQTFYNVNGEIRYLRNYKIADIDSTFAGGYLTYNLDSPYVAELGSTPASNHGVVNRRLDRQTIVNSVFAENRFTVGKFMITPGVRHENIRQTVDERKNTVANSARNVDTTANVTLLGVGASYYVDDASQIYANVSEAYKPIAFQETIPLGSATTISSDIKPAKILSYELGYRGQREKFSWDTSVFFIRYENKIAQIGSNFQNSGAGESKGIDLAGEYKFTPEWNVFANTELLQAKLTGGQLKGRTPQYAPKTLTRAGVIYRKEDKVKVALSGVMVGRHYGNDDNGNSTAGKNDYEIPYYTVWDLTGDYTIYKNWMLSGGINNLLDKQYFSKVRGGGVHWAMGRNYYAGVTYKF